MAAHVGNPHVIVLAAMAPRRRCGFLGGSFHLDRIGLRRCRLLVAAAELVRRGHTSSPFPALRAWHHQCGGRRGGVQADLAVLHCRRAKLGAAASHDGQESRSNSCIGQGGARGSVQSSSMGLGWLFALDRGLLGCAACCSASRPSIDSSPCSKLSSTSRSCSCASSRGGYTCSSPIGHGGQKVAGAHILGASLATGDPGP